MKRNLALAAIALVLLLGAAQSSNSVPGQLKDIQSQLSGLEAQIASLANKGPRKFYLTRTQHMGNEALSACAPGYHMASLWEIHDPTNLRYDTGLGFTRDDSGLGPPVGDDGWIRTGNFSSHSVPKPGSANCDAYTTPNGSGTLVFLPVGWEPPPEGNSMSVVEPWLTRTAFCGTSQRVWCVQD